MTPEKAQRAVIMLGGVGIVAVIYADVKGGGPTTGSDFSQAIDLTLWTALAAMISEGAPDVGIGLELVLLLNLLFPISGKPSILTDLFSKVPAPPASADTSQGGVGSVGPGNPVPSGADTFGGGTTPGPAVPGGNPATGGP